MSFQTELRQQITSRIVTALKAGTQPWRRPWSGGGTGSPTNIATGKQYRGINPLLLQITAQERGWQSPWWGTYRQWQSVGGQVMRRPDGVREGEWGTKIVFYSPITKVIENEDGAGEEERFFVLRQFTVFNLEQVTGDSLEPFRVKPQITAASVNFAPAEEAILATRADIRFGGDRAFYSRSGDYIQLPPRESFARMSDFYATGFHELVHWSEHRLKWKGSYAMGELRAEIGGCFLCNELNIPQSQDLTNHNAYLASWLRELENDYTLIFRASQQASKAADFILSFSRGVPTTTEVGHEMVGAV